MRLRRILAAMALAIGATIAGSAPGGAQQKVILTHGTEGFSYVVPFIAETMGYFKQAGVAVEFLRTQSGTQSLGAVISRNADIFIGSTESPINSRKRGSDIVLFAALFTQYSSNVTVSKAWAERHGLSRTSPLAAKLAALKDLRVGITGPGSGTDQIVRYLAGEARLDPERDMTIVPIGSEGSAMLAALSQNRIDGISISSPTSHIAMRDQGALVLFNMGIGDVPALDGYFQVGAAASEAWLKANRDTALRVAQAFQMALNTLRDPAANRAARDAVHAARHSRIDPALYELAWSELERGTPPSVTVTQKMVADIIAFHNRFAREKMDEALAATAFNGDIAAEALKTVPSRP